MGKEMADQSYSEFLWDWRICRQATIAERTVKAWIPNPTMVIYPALLKNSMPLALIMKESRRDGQFVE